MRAFLSVLAILMSVSPSAAPDGMSFADGGGAMSLAQYRGDTYTRTDDRPRRRERYVCVVEPPQSSERQRPYVCRADAGRVGGRCRCPNLVGSGRLELDD